MNLNDFSKAIISADVSLKVPRSMFFFIKINILKVQDMFKLKLFKLYYKLSCDLLPTYFNTYRDVLMQVPERSHRQNLIHPPFVKRVYSECGLLI